MEQKAWVACRTPSRIVVCLYQFVDVQMVGREHAMARRGTRMYTESFSPLNGLELNGSHEVSQRASNSGSGAGGSVMKGFCVLKGML